MEKIKKYSLGKLFDKPHEQIDFAIVDADDLRKLASSDANSGVAQFHKHDFYTIFWIESGYLTQILDEKTFYLQQGDVFIICPGQVHENDFTEASTSIKGGAILFTIEFINQLRLNNEIVELTFLDNIFSNPHLHLSETGLDRYLSISNALTKEMNTSAPYQPVVRSLCTALLLLMQQVVDASAVTTIPNRHIEVFKKFKYLLELYYKDNKPTGFYADALHLSERHLNRLLKEATSRTAAQVIRARSMLEARRLLGFTDLTVTEIAGSLGYLDNSNFTKVFKKEIGYAPQAYRSLMS